MNKFQISSFLTVIILMAWYHQPVQAQLTEETLLCLFQKTVHADGKFKQAEQDFFREGMKVGPELIEQLKQKCETSTAQNLKNLQQETRIGESIDIVLIIAYLVNSDGKVKRKERKFLEALLKAYELNSDAKPLLELATMEAMENNPLQVREKVSQAYPFKIDPKTEYETRRNEIPLNVASIKKAVLNYEKEYDIYVDCVQYPSMPSYDPRPWNLADSGGFSTLGWQPDGDIRGAYAVEVTYGDDNFSMLDFTVIGLSDVDDDGYYATYIATKSTDVTRITPDEVY